MISAPQSSSSSSVDCRLNTGPGSWLLNGVMGICGSGEVEGVVDFREEEAVVIRSFEDEAEADNRSDCFPKEDGEGTGGGLGFRDVAADMEGATGGCLRDVTLLSVALAETTRLVGSAANRVFGNRGDFEAAFAKLFAALPGSCESALVARWTLVPICFGMAWDIPGFFAPLAVVVVLGGFRGGGEKTFGFDGAVLLEEGVLESVDADLRITGGDLTLGLRMTPETVRFRMGVGAGDSLDLTDNAEMGDFVVSGCEGVGRRCGVDFPFWSCCSSGFREFCLDEASEVAANGFALTQGQREPGFLM